jgi:hypothetical protein
MNRTLSAVRRATAAVAIVVLGTAITATAAGAATKVTSVAVAMNAPTSSAGGATSYVVHFKTSASGALSGDSGASVSVVFPSGTTFGSMTSSTLSDGVNPVGGCTWEGGTLVQCFVYGGTTLAASHTAVATLNGVTNPVAGTYHLSVSTSKDTAAQTSPNYTVTAKTGLASASVVMSAPTSSAGGATSYVVSFKTSATGALAGDTGSLINIVFPAGTSFASMTSSTVSDGVNAIGGCTWEGGATVECFVYGGSALAANHTAVATINGVTNTAAGNYHLTVSTSSDTTASSASFTVTAATRASNVSLSLSSNVASATNVTYRISLKLTSGLAGDTGSLVKLVLGTGTGFASMGSSPLNDGLNEIGGCTWEGATSVECFVFGGTVAHAGDTLTAQLTSLTNPSTTKGYTLHTSTSSDSIVVSNSYCVAAVNKPCISSVAPTSGAVGAAVAISGLNLAGATSVKFHGTTAVVGTDTATKVSTTVPAGATTGTITVTTSSGTATSAQTFTVTP